MKPTIIAIVGPSGSGKTFLTKYLQNELNIPFIVSTTTRPRRRNEVEGRDYYFIKNTRKYRRRDMLTYTRFGDYEYFSLRSQVPETGMCTYVVDENGVESLKKRSGGEFNVFSVVIACSYETLLKRGIILNRIERDLNRKQLQSDKIDLIVGNNGTLEEFKEAVNGIIKIVEQWQHLQ